jgi:hypothetical protein
VDIDQLFQRVLKRELEKHNDPQRAAEGVYAFSLDNQLEIPLALEALKALEAKVFFAESSGAARRLFTENETLEVLTRERVLARREATRENALELARAGDAEGLRRVSGRNLQTALQRAKPLEAKALIEAWNLLPLYEQERPA